MELLMILGSPASGKTTLALRLARDLGVPVLCKDDVKEGLFDILGTPDRAASRRFSEASFAALLRLATTQLGAGLSCLLEGNFRAEHAPAVGALLAGTGGRAGQVWCRAPPAQIMRRFAARTRHPGHQDRTLPEADLRRYALAPPAFLELAGPRWVHDGEAADGYAATFAAIQKWRL